VLGEPSHLADEGAETIKILVEGLERMFPALLH
jgi:hypothetical protein